MKPSRRTPWIICCVDRLPQPAHVLHVNEIAVRYVCVIPDFLEQHCARNHLRSDNRALLEVRHPRQINKPTKMCLGITFVMPKARQDSLFHLDLNGSAVVIGGTGKDRQVATRGLVLAAHQLADRSDCIHDGCAGRVGHETLQWL
jgi:hypothetical protein